MTRETNPFTHSVMMAGLYMGIAMCVGDLFFFISGNAFSDWSVLVTFGTLILGINMGIRHFRDVVLEGTISFSRAWAFSIGMSFYAAFLYAFFIYLYIRFFDESILEIFIDLEKEALLSGGYTPEDLEKFMSMRGNEKLFTPYGVAIAQIFQINIYGIAIGLVASLFNQRKNVIGSWLQMMKQRNLPTQKK